MNVTGLILAGGRGSRMDGADKGLQPFAGRPLIEHAIERLRPQVGHILISANRNGERYAAYGCPVLGDRLGGFLGPLAGIDAALAECTTPYLATVPCDAPYFPADLVAHLLTAIGTADAVIVADHPVFALLRRDTRQALADYLASGGRKVRDWYGGLCSVTVDFADGSAFANLNTREELATGCSRPSIRPS